MGVHGIWVGASLASLGSSYDNDYEDYTMLRLVPALDLINFVLSSAETGAATSVPSASWCPHVVGAQKQAGYRVRYLKPHYLRTWTIAWRVRET